jgi:hypothetical protein
MDLLVKIFKWCVCATLFVIGCGFLFATDATGSIKPIFVALVSFGILYWLSQSFFGMARKLLLINCIVLVAAAGCAFYLYQGFDAFRGWRGYDVFFEWALWCYAIGIPVMGISFKKFD